MPDPTPEEEFAALFSNPTSTRTEQDPLVVSDDAGTAFESFLHGQLAGRTIPSNPTDESETPS